MAEDIVALVKEKNRIEDVIEADGYSLRGGSGRYRRCAKHDSLVVDLNNQAYHWNSQGEHGDVINWVMARKRTDFKGAVDLLCDRARVERPHWGNQDTTHRVAARKRLDAFSVASTVLVRWLWRSDVALAYVRGRGWTDEVIKRSMLGFTGERSNMKTLRSEMLAEFKTASVDPKSPGAVAVLGYVGDVAGWCKVHEITAPDDWLANGRIPGLIARGMMVYPHVEGGKVVYFSGRSIRDKYHFNLPVQLAGERMPYHNTQWSPRESEVVIVEGQADAVTLDQWEIPAIAIMGTSSDEAMMTKLAERNSRIPKIYAALDSDQAGQAKVATVCEAVSPLVRVLHWPERDGVKDANDLLQKWIEDGKEHERQMSLVQGMQVNSVSYLEEIAAQCGATKDRTDRDAMELDVLKQYIRLDETQLAQYRDRVATALGRKMRDFDRLVKQLQGKATANDDERPDRIEPIWGGYHDGYLFEYLLDMNNKTAMLAYREPDNEDGTQGRIGKAAYVDVRKTGEWVRYVPEEPYDFVLNGSVLFPSNLGDHREQRELVAIIESFLRRYYLFDDDTLPRIIAYYVLMTWLYDAFNALSYLRALGGAGSGKTELMRRIGFICYRAISSSGSDTPASLFRTVEQFGGTLVIDEYDQEGGGDTTSDFVKVLNMGAMKGGSVTRMAEYVDINGDKKMRPSSFSTYCPKLLNGRLDMKDDAVGTRCLTFRLMPHVQIELMNENIPLFIDSIFRQQAQAIRNLLVRWRLENWQEEVKIKNEDLDPEISPRLNQVTASMKAIARLSGDTAVIVDLTKLLRELYAQEVANRSETLEARVVEALWKIYLYPDLHEKYLSKNEIGTLYVYPGSVAEVTNQLIKEMNNAGKTKTEDEDEETEGKKDKKGKEMGARGAGAIMRNDLQLKALARKKSGIPYAWHEVKLVAHALRYGVEWEQVLAHVLGNNPKENIPNVVLELAKRRHIEPAVPETIEEKVDKALKEEKNVEKQGKLDV